MPAVHTVNKRDFVWALVSFPEQWPWFSVWELDCMCACVQDYKMASYATDSSRAVLWTAILTRVNLKLWRRWVVGKLRAVMSISFVLKSRWVLEPFSSYRCLTSGLNKERRRKKTEEYEKWHFCYRTLLRLAVFRVAFGQLYESCWSQRHSKRNPGRLNKLLACLWWSYTAYA